MCPKTGKRRLCPCNRSVLVSIGDEGRWTNLDIYIYIFAIRIILNDFGQPRLLLFFLFIPPDSNQICALDRPCWRGVTLHTKAPRGQDPRHMHPGHALSHLHLRAHKWSLAVTPYVFSISHFPVCAIFLARLILLNVIILKIICEEHKLWIYSLCNLSCISLLFGNLSYIILWGKNIVQLRIRKRKKWKLIIILNELTRLIST